MLLRWRNLVNGPIGQLTRKRPLYDAIINKKYSKGIGFEGQDSVSKEGTIFDVKAKMMKILGLDQEYSPIPKSREHLSSFEPKLEDLPPRTMQDSFTSAIIPLSQDNILRDRYVALLGHVRLGRLMEDMDLFAVWICLQHVHYPKLPKDIHLPYTFVTILVDKVDFTTYVPKATVDIRLSGHVSWVGSTSMEIVVWLEQQEDGVNRKITRALFLMAARNATNTGGLPVNPINPGNEEEKKILSGGEDRKKQRQKMHDSSFLKSRPNDMEQKIMHDLFLRTTPQETLELNVRVLPNRARWMGDSQISSTNASFPEHRNNHNNVFGGYIMRNSLEISWVAAYLYGKTRPHLDHICDISFQKPVNVSSFMKMTAHVVYTEMNYIQIMTVANTLDAHSSTTSTSNKFYYTFRTNEKVAEILPRSYHETMWYLEGRRKFKYALGRE